MAAVRRGAWVALRYVTAIFFLGVVVQFFLVGYGLFGMKDGATIDNANSLQAGEQLTSEVGAMTFVSGDIAMEVEMPAGFVGGLKRKLLAGESLFVTRYSANGPGSVGITGPFPGSIRQHDLDGEIICEKH